MIMRPFWLRKIEDAWSKRSILWLSGVRRVGKTTLTRMLSPTNLIYKNCDLPSVRRELEDPEFFLDSLPTGTTVALDEVHRLEDPSLLLKIASDEFPSLKIIATGSSTLAASHKFQDSLTGRKHVVHLAPVLWQECRSIFGIQDLDRRLLHGGLPEALLASDKDSEFFAEWLDSVYARDIQELFHVRNRTGFLDLVGLLMRQSGGQLDVTKLAQDSGLARPTVNSYLESLQFAHLVRIVRPLHGSSKREIVKRPKCYAFDTGFVTHEKGWDVLRPEDRGLLWEHLVLDTLCTQFSPESILYWKDKSNREIDFVVRTKRDMHHIVECKIDVDRVPTSIFEEFRKRYPNGKNFAVSPRVRQPYRTRKDGIEITYCDGSNLGDTET
ncbi:MAG: ATP-binding protein [Gammaproteobacteria bacterium]|nr:ATP-binding protein [Gammaproteobacteria bacterium]